MITAYQTIYYGAPGTGKSYIIDENLKDIANDYLYRVTIHPEFTYSDFIGQLIPKVIERENGEKEISYDFHKGVFTRALEKAYEDTSNNVYLILEEMSRGDVAAIFGDIFQLLDRIQTGAQKGYSRYFIDNQMIAKDILALPEDRVKLPPNLFLIGTVNTSDQNVFVMDTAFKRRFDWQYVSAKPIKNTVDTFLNNPEIKIVNNDGTIKGVQWVDFYMFLNKFITDKEYLELSEDKQIGQFFIEFGNDVEYQIKHKIQNKLLQYLWSDIHKASFKKNIKLFSDSVSNFSELYDMFENDNSIFSNEFINFLNKND